MRKSEFKYVIVFLLLTLGCFTGRASLVGEVINLQNQAEKDSSISTELAACIESYITEMDTLFPKDVKAIYSVYFFEKDGKDYFTAWGNYILPYYIEQHNSSKKFDYTVVDVKNRDIVLIQSNETDKTKMYKEGKEKTGKDKVDKIKRSDIKYDGPSFPSTYEYHLEKGKYIISLSDSLYVDFLGVDFLKYGELVKDDK